jgi:hypothetical protein
MGRQIAPKKEGTEMDEATKAYRRRMKAQAGPKSERNSYESRGLGRKAKPHVTFPNVQCNYRDPESKQRCPRNAALGQVKFKTRFGTSTGHFCLTCLPKIKKP